MVMNTTFMLASSYASEMPDSPVRGAGDKVGAVKGTAKVIYSGNAATANQPSESVMMPSNAVFDVDGVTNIIIKCDKTAEKERRKAERK